ncbi:MAG: hypothetical protein JWR80_9941 [Bradyrhizobium sp.]|nr:hypothetical protein [Bradyrhizobium sp.]
MDNTDSVVIQTPAPLDQIFQDCRLVLLKTPRHHVFSDCAGHREVVVEDLSGIFRLDACEERDVCFERKLQRRKFLDETPNSQIVRLVLRQRIHRTTPGPDTCQGYESQVTRRVWPHVGAKSKQGVDGRARRRIADRAGCHGRHGRLAEKLVNAMPKLGPTGALQDPTGHFEMRASSRRTGSSAAAGLDSPAASAPHIPAGRFRASAVPAPPCRRNRRARRAGTGT